MLFSCREEAPLVYSSSHPWNPLSFSVKLGSLTLFSRSNPSRSRQGATLTHFTSKRRDQTNFSSLTAPLGSSLSAKACIILELFADLGSINKCANPHFTLLLCPCHFFLSFLHFLIHLVGTIHSLFLPFHPLVIGSRSLLSSR